MLLNQIFNTVVKRFNERAPHLDMYSHSYPQTTLFELLINEVIELSRSVLCRKTVHSKLLAFLVSVLLFKN
jgi:hypothetical protein